MRIEEHKEVFVNTRPVDKHTLAVAHVEAVVFNPYVSFGAR